MRALFTGGGTGGHIYPALAVAVKLKEKGWDILYIGSRNGLERKIIPKKGITFQTVDVAPLPRKLSAALVKTAIRAGKGFFQAGKIIRTYNPDIVLGTGGFVAGPVVLAASIRNFPTVIHEQNAYPGITNKILAYKVNKIALNFATAKNHFSKLVSNKIVVTGNPVREVILKTEYEEGIKKLGLNFGKKTILATGGSQGAQSINKAMITVCKYYRNNKDIQIIYITGEKKYREVIESIPLERIKNIKILPYLHNIEWAYAAADLVINRAGATGLAEITARGIPAILIPYPHATGNHQEYNARNLEKNGAAEVILDKELTGKILLAKIESLLNDEEKLLLMKENSKKLGKPEARDNLIQVMNSII